MKFINLYIKIFIILYPILVSSTLLDKNYKLCKNCKYFINNRECQIFGNIDLVNGKLDYDLAKSVRNNENKCGSNAIYYEENKLKFITIPYYFIKNYWPVVFTLITYILFYIYIY